MGCEKNFIVRVQLSSVGYLVYLKALVLKVSVRHVYSFRVFFEYI